MALSEVYPILWRWAVTFFILLSGLVYAGRGASFSTGDEPILGFGLVDAFPGIQFNQPVVITSPPGETNLLFVVERLGKVYGLTNLSRPNKTLLIDLTSTTASDGGYEPGLLGMAFHPNFRTNGFFFLYRTLLGPEGYYDQLSRFRANPKTLAVDNSSEEIVLQQRDLRYIQHNAGDIHFGPDGYLYISLGESSPPEEDYQLTRQPIDKNFFGVMLRIDVDKRAGNLQPNPHPGVFGLYLVPKDNPFVGATEYQGVRLNPQTVRTEIFALGLRNPWRFCFDPVSGEIFCGDVGEQTYEEVNVIRRGANYGWPYLEGPMQTEYFPIRPSGFSSEPPLWSYLHQSGSFGGQAIIGGCIYTGNSLPGLQRAFIFGDNVRGHIWALIRDLVHGTNQIVWLAGEPSVSTFGLDPRDNEILLASLITGRIRKLVYRDPAASAFPALLSQTGLFDDTRSLTPASGVTPYEVNAPFWSDYATKKRWFALPKNTYFTLNSSNGLAAPQGTIWIKHFELETIRNNPATRRRLETRLLIKGNSGTYGVTYKWNTAGTDAALVSGSGADEDISVSEAGVSRLQTWHYPSRGECRLCHNPLAGDALGFSGEQLNCPDAETGLNQLASFATKSYLKGYNPNAPPEPLAGPTNTNFSVEHRVRSFMQANCAQCHFPGNPIIARWDARFHTLLADKNLSSAIQPGHPESSPLFTRLAVRDLLHMPPIATAELNNDGLTLVDEWISGIPVAPWQSSALGTPAAKGTSLVWSDSVETTAYPGILQFPAGEYVFRPATGSVHLVTRISTRKLSGATTQAGIRFSSSNKDGPAYFAGVTSSGLFSQIGKNGAISDLSAADDPVWLRVTAEPDGVRLFKLNGQNWEQIETVSNAFDRVKSVGLAVTSAEDNSNEQFARFENVSILTASLRLLEGSTNQSVQGQSQLECVLDGQNYTVQKVDFFSNGEFLGEARSEPYTIDWATNAPGTYNLTARVLTRRGFTLSTSPVQIKVSAPPAEGWFLTEDSSTQGDWASRYGKAGYFTPGFSSWPQQNAGLSLLNDKVRTVDSATAIQTLLTVPNSSARATSYWAGSDLTVSMTFADGLLHKVSLYVAAPTGGSTTISLRDRSSKSVLDARTIDSSAGIYVSFFVKGGADFVLSGPGEAKLYGIFLDNSPYPAPNVTLGVLPPAIFGASTLRINADAGTNFYIAKMDFYVDGLRRRTLTGPPFSFAVTNLSVGSHVLNVTATDQQHQSADTNTTLQVLVPPPAAKFLGTDDQTRGNWQSTYGHDGYLIVGGNTNLPVYAPFSVSNQTVYTFDFPLSDLAKLVSPEDGTRSSSVWTSPFFMSFDLTLNDGLAHELALYVFDIPGVFREELVRVLDPIDGRILSEATLSSFEAGRYYRWSIQGAVRFQILAKAGTVSLAGIFLDPFKARSPGVTIFSPQTGGTVPAPSRLNTRLFFSDPDGLIERTEFYVDNQLFNEFPYRADVAELPRVLAGSHWLSAAAVDYFGTRRWSPPVLLTGLMPPAAAQFLSADRNTGGDWRDKYGSDGWAIARSGDNFGALASYEISPQTIWLWEGSPTNKEALLRNGGGRIAAAWYDGGAGRTLNLKLSFLDGEPHAVSLYFLDYQSGERVQTINVLDTTTGAVLDKQTLSKFDDGTYLTWRVQGRVTFQIKSVLSTPVVSGIFIDAGLNYQGWLTNYFPTLLSAGLETPDADPDNDGMPNELEFLTGLNPLRAEPLWAYSQDLVSGEVVFELDLARNRDGAIPALEYTADLKAWSAAEGVDPVIRTNQTQRILQYRFPANQRGRALYFRVGAVDAIF